MLDMLIYRCRATIYNQQIDHDNMRGLIRQLKDGEAIWYSPDQDFGLKQGVMAPFFGVPAATVTAHRRLLKMTKAVAIPCIFTVMVIFVIHNTKFCSNPLLIICRVKMNLQMQ
jgi:KDO2-lipid IV(A) lauroyltransferase